MDRLRALTQGMDFIPFVMMAGQHAKMSVARILEALIIAIVTGGVVMYGVTQTLDAKQTALKELYDRDHSATVDWRRYVQAEIDKNRERIFVLQSGGKVPPVSARNYASGEQQGGTP